METAIVSLICIALIVFGGMTMGKGFLSSVDTSTLGWEDMGERDETIMRTELSPLTATTSDNGQSLKVMLDNSGQTKLANFSKWDVIIQYYDDSGAYYSKWLPYTEGTPSDNEWTVTAIYLNQQTEAFEPNILNPGEEIEVQVRLNPSIGRDTSNLVVISSPNGVAASIAFSR